VSSRAMSRVLMKPSTWPVTLPVSESMTMTRLARGM
jgi:hypothetical protein